MTKEQLEKRRKIAKIVGISLPAAGFLIPLAMGIKDKDIKGGAFVGIFGLMLGAVLAAGAVMAILPSSETKEK